MNRSRSGYIFIVLCAVIFSTMEVMLKTVHGVFAPMQITCLRFLVGGVLLIPFAMRSISAMMWFLWISSCSRKCASTVTKIGLQEKMTATMDARV